MPLGTPPPPLPSCYIGEPPETPAPIRARVNNQANQINALVTKNHAQERKHRAEAALLENTITDQKAQLTDTRSTLAGVQATLMTTQKELKSYQTELERCKSEGDGMRDELNLQSVIHQHKALLLLAQEQIQVVELEQRLVQAEAARIMRDHKLALFQAKEADLLAELVEKDAQLEQLHSSEGVKGQLADSRSQLVGARQQIIGLEAKMETLETKVRSLKEREKEARAEIDAWLRDERGKDGSANKEKKKELQTALRTAKTELHKKKDELADLQEELESVKVISKEREKSLKAKLRETDEERQRLAGVEDDLETLRATASSAQAQASKAKEALRAASEGVPPEKTLPVVRPTIKARNGSVAKLNAALDAPRKAAPASDSDSEVDPLPKKKPSHPKPAQADSDSDARHSPREKSKKPIEESKKKAPLRDSAEGINRAAKRKSPEPEKAKSGKGVVSSQAEGENAPEKKKRRKLFGAQPTFTWDPIMSSGDGVIPSFLSPVKTSTTGMLGAIPRLGFSSAASRGFGRF